MQDLAAKGAISELAFRTLLAEIDRDLDTLDGPGSRLVADLLPGEMPEGATTGEESAASPIEDTLRD